MKKRTKTTTLLLVAILAMLILASCAVAAAHFTGAIDWFGPVLTEEEALLEASGGERLTVPDAESVALAQKARNLMESKPHGEHWLFLPPDAEVIGNPTEEISSIRQARARIASGGAEMLLPGAMPDGYEYSSGYLYFYDTQKTLEEASKLSEEAVEDGLVLQKFRRGEDYWENIEGYVLRFENAQGGYLVINCELDELGTQYAFKTGDEWQTVEMDGMTNGLYIRDENASSLYKLLLRKEGIAPIDYATGTPGESDVLLWQYEAVNYTLESNVLDKDALAQIAQNLE